MKFKLVMIPFLVAISLPACAETASVSARPDLSPLATNVDVLPSLDPSFKSPWDNAALKQAITQGFGQKIADTIYKDWTATGLFEFTLLRKGNILYTVVAKPHSVNTDKMVIFINLGANAKDPSANTLQACFRERRLGKQYVYWLATGKPAREILPNECPDLITSDQDKDGFGVLRKYNALQWGVPSAN